MSNLGDMIKQKREALKMGQAAVSGLLGLGGKRAQATISQYENNVRPVVLDDYSALAKLLGLPVDEVKAIAAKDVRAHKAALKRRKDKREGKCRDLPIAVPAPERFSTTMGWPSTRSMKGPLARAAASDPPPGA